MTEIIHQWDLNFVKSLLGRITREAATKFDRNCSCMKNETALPGDDFGEQSEVL